MSGRVFRWLVVGLLLLLVAVPLYWILDTSFKTGRQILMSEAIYIPKPFTRAYVQHLVATAVQGVKR